MTQRRFLVTYDAIAADVLNNGPDRPAALVILAAGRQRVIIRMEQDAITRLQARIAATFARRKVVLPLRS